MTESIRRALQILLALCFVFTLFSCSRPPNRENIQHWARAKGWQWRGGLKMYDREDQLFTFVSQQAQKAIDAGWLYSLIGELKMGGGGKIAYVTIHVMESREATAELFEELASAGEEVKVGNEAIYWGGTMRSEYVVFRKGTSFCEITLNNKNEDEEVVELAKSLAKKLG